MTISQDEARLLEHDWRLRFDDDEAFDRCWRRYWQTAEVPDVGRLERWLSQDLERLEAKRAALAKDPENYALGPSRYDLNGCYHCYGYGYVRVDLPISHPQFGKALRCPACLSADGDRSAHCPKCAAFSVDTLEQPPNRCMHCHQTEDQPAGEQCHNPRWHIPNERHWTSEEIAAYRPNKIA